MARRRLPAPTAGHLELLRRAARAARRAGRRARALPRSVAARIGERRFRHIRRETRARCWCGGELEPLASHRAYGVCVRCGAYVNRRPPVHDDLAELYSLGLYWRKRQRSKGFPPIERRAELYRRDGRLRRWLELIERHGPDSGRVVEVGCAPGVLLQELAGRGYACTGVEISEPVAAWLREELGLDVRPGFFPGVDLPSCDLFLAFDVLEHSPTPSGFLNEAARLLRPGGTAIVQTPVDRYDYRPPFGQRSDLFDELEHLFLFTDRSLELLAERAGLEVVSLEERLWVGGELAVFHKPAA